MTFSLIPSSSPPFYIKLCTYIYGTNLTQFRVNVEVQVEVEVEVKVEVQVEVEVVR